MLIGTVARIPQIAGALLDFNAEPALVSAFGLGSGLTGAGYRLRAADRLSISKSVESLRVYSPNRTLHAVSRQCKVGRRAHRLCERCVKACIRGNYLRMWLAGKGDVRHVDALRCQMARSRVSIGHVSHTGQNFAFVEWG